MSKKIYALFLIVGHFLPINLVYAENNKKMEQQNEQNVVELPSLDINASMPIDSLNWSIEPKTQTIISAVDGADYLRNIPGFNATRQGGTNGDPVLRGMYGSRINIQSNDSMILGACGMRMDNPLSYVAPNTFDRIIITKGPQTVKYGTTASAGTIRFERDLKYYEEPTLNANIDILVGTNSRNDQNISSDIGNEIGYIRINASRSKASDYRDGKGQKVHSNWEKSSGDIAVGLTPNPDTVLELSSGAGNAITAYAGRPLDGTKFDRTSYGARFAINNLTDNLRKVEANYYYNHAEHEMSNKLREKDPSKWFANTPDRRTNGGKITSDFVLGNIGASIGVDVAHNVQRGSNKIPNAYYENTGAFSALTFGIEQGNRTILGLRFDQQKTHDKRKNDTNLYYGQIRIDSLTSGFVRYEQDPSINSTWYVGVGHSQRVGDFWEMMGSGGYQTFGILKPEKTSQLDIGFNYKTNKLEAWVSSYAGYIKDYILISFTPKRAVDNIDATIAGSEAGIVYYFDNGFNLGSNLAYSWGEKHSKGKALPHASSALPQIPPLNVNLNGGFSNDIWQVNAILQVTARQNRITKNQGTIVTQDLTSTPGFALMHLNGSYKLPYNFILSAGVDNLFDRFYYEHLNLTGIYAENYDFVNNELISSPGRTAWLKVSYIF